MKTMFNVLLLTRISQKNADWALLVFRVALSISLINTHGMKKLLNFNDTVLHIPDPFGIGGELSAYIAVFANIICPVFIIPGLMTRLWLIPILSITFTGFLVVHAADPWSIRDVPLMYSLAFSLLFILGPGSISLDKILFDQK